MYERFTDRSRKVLQLANQEAQRLNHEYVGPEHILLGLAKEGSGVATNVLKNMGADPHKIRLELEKLVEPGPEKVIMGKMPQTPRAKWVIENAIDAAKELNHNYIGTEHLLLGLVRLGEGIANQVLTNLGIKAETVKEQVLALVGQKTPEPEAATVTQVHIPKQMQWSTQWNVPLLPAALPFYCTEWHAEQDHGKGETTFTARFKTADSVRKEERERCIRILKNKIKSILFIGDVAKVGITNVEQGIVLVIEEIIKEVEKE